MSIFVILLIQNISCAFQIQLCVLFVFIKLDLYFSVFFVFLSFLVLFEIPEMFINMQMLDSALIPNTHFHLMFLFVFPKKFQVWVSSFSYFQNFKGFLKCFHGSALLFNLVLFNVQGSTFLQLKSFYSMSLRIQFQSLWGGWLVCDTSSRQITEVKHTCPEPVTGLVSRLVFTGSIPTLLTNLQFQNHLKPTSD